MTGERERATIGDRLSQRAASTAYRASRVRRLSPHHDPVLHRRQRLQSRVCSTWAEPSDCPKASPMSQPDFVAAFLDSLDDETLAAVAERLRPHLAEGRDREGLISSRQAAQALGLSERSVVRMARDGRIPGAVKVGRRWRFPAGPLVVHAPRGQSPALSPRPTRASGSSRQVSVNAIRGELT